ncbi:hypothetical protein FRC03_008839 [Tulasnella sp. 419]|nr:hypothetical protein FRC03_008839 [Tulasnella sp. 419]
MSVFSETYPTFDRQCLVTSEACNTSTQTPTINTTTSFLIFIAIVVGIFVVITFFMTIHLVILFGRRPQTYIPIEKPTCYPLPAFLTTLSLRLTTRAFTINILDAPTIPFITQFLNRSIHHRRAPASDLEKGLSPDSGTSSSLSNIPIPKPIPIPSSVFERDLDYPAYNPDNLPQQALNFPTFHDSAIYPAAYRADLDLEAAAVLKSVRTTKSRSYIATTCILDH